MEYPKVYIIILNYKGWADTIECLESIFRNSYPNYQVIVIDNGSSDNSVEYIKSWVEGELNIWVKPQNPLRYLSHPPLAKKIPYVFYSRKEAEKGGSSELELEAQNTLNSTFCINILHPTTKYPLIFIQTGDNLGYAGGNNIGIRYALAKDDFGCIWILNNDTVIDKNALSDIMNAAINDEHDRPIGSYIYEYYEPEKLQLYGGLKFRKYFILRPTFAKLNERIDCISGVSLFLSKNEIKELGLLEEKYFMSSEDLEYTFFYKENFNRTHKGIPPLLVAGKIWHKKAKSQNKNKFLHSYYFTRNILYVSFEINKISFFLTFFYAISRGIFYYSFNKREQSKGIFRGITDFMNNKTGRYDKENI